MLRLISGMAAGLVMLAVAVAATPTARAEMTCPPPIDVTVDIKPGSYPNSIKLSSNGTVTVAVITTSTFDATQFAPEMAHLGDSADGMSCAGAMAYNWTLKDVNGDRKPDLVFKFNTADLDLTPASTSATFMAHGMLAGVETHITGSDSVRVLP